MRVADQIHLYLRRLHPDQRKAIKSALRALGSGSATDVLALKDGLEGYYRLRVGRFRILCRHLDSGKISCEFIDVRATVYERFTSMQELIRQSWLLNDPAASYPAPRRRSRPSGKATGASRSRRG